MFIGFEPTDYKASQIIHLKKHALVSVFRKLKIQSIHTLKITYRVKHLGEGSVLSTHGSISTQIHSLFKKNSSCVISIFTNQILC